MAKPLKIKNKNGTVSYRIFVNNSNTRESKTFSTRQLAIDWADKRKREIERAQIYGEKTSLTIKQVLDDYQAQFSTTYGSV